MRFNIISNLTNGVGLERDYQALKPELERRGHTVMGVQFNAKPFRIEPADVNIFDEVVNPEAFSAAPQQWVMPHPEWWFAGWEKHWFDKVLAKTHDCERIFRTKVGDRCQYLGWAARDLYQPSVARERRFLHVCGKSQMKNTEAVIQGCRLAGVKLTVIGEHAGARKRVSEQELAVAMNSHFCQVMPSEYEGYGHVLHEALSTGQIIITTDAPPMNEISPAVLVPCVRAVPHHAATLFKVSAAGVERAVRQVLEMSQDQIDAMREQSLRTYEKEVIDWHKALDQLVGSVQDVVQNTA